MRKTLDLYITKICNLNCEYCYVDIGNDTIPFSQEKFLERKNLLDYDHIKFFGGEPLLRWKEIVLIVDTLKKRKNKIRFTIVSNGVLIDQKKCDFIRDNNISLVISVHPQPGMKGLSSQVGFISSTLSMYKYDFLFVLNRKGFGEILKNISYLVNQGIKNIHITPDTSVLWLGENLKFLKKSLNKLENLALRYHDITIRFSDTNNLLFDNISCKKEIYYAHKYHPCNRFQKNHLLGVEFFQGLEDALTHSGFFQHKYKNFFSCPIGYFLDHMGKEKDIFKIAKAYIEVNNIFIEAQKKVSLSKQEDNFLTISPKNLRFNITNQCNIRCNYCYVDFDNSFLNKREILMIVEYFVHKGSWPEIISFFGGEPLLRFDDIQTLLPAIHDIYKKYNLKAPSFQIATNALLLNQEKLDILFKYNVEIHISIGGSEKYHNIFRDNSYQKMDRICKKLDLYLNKNIVFLLMISEENVQSLCKEYIILSQKGISKIHLECIFHKDQWCVESKKILQQQLRLIYAYDKGKHLHDYQNTQVFDISTSGEIAQESLGFHDEYNMGIKKYLDSYIQKIFNF